MAAPLRKRYRRGIGPVPITLHDLRTAHRQFAGFARGSQLGGILLVEQDQLGPRQRLADRARAVLAFIGVGRDHARALGEAVAFADARAARRLERRLDRRGQRCAARNAHAQRSEIGFRQPRVIEQRLVHRRHPRHRGGLDPLQRLERGPRLEPGQHRDAPAHRHGAVEHAGVGKDMEQRQHPHDDVAAALARIDRLNLAGVGGEVLVAEHCPLGGARGAPGILDQRDVALGIDCDRNRRCGGEHVAPPPQIGASGDRCQRFAPEQAQGHPFETRLHLRERSDHPRLELRAIKHLERIGQERGDIDRDQHSRPRIGDLRRQFGDGVERREIDHGRPGNHRAVICREINRDVGQEQSDAVALGDAQRLQPGCKRLRLGEKLGVAVLPPEEIDERRIAKPRRGGCEHRRDG